LNPLKQTDQNIQLLTAQAVGAKLSLSKRAVFRMRSAGLICSPVKLGLEQFAGGKATSRIGFRWAVAAKRNLKHVRRRENDE
jgi:hypothetical protein